VGVDQSVFKASVSEESHDVNNAFGFVIFGGGFPVAESVQVDVGESRVLGGGGYSVSALLIDSAYSAELCSAEDLLGFAS
jgi:hypothetical protein